VNFSKSCLYHVVVIDCAHLNPIHASALVSNDGTKLAPADIRDVYCSARRMTIPALSARGPGAFIHSARHVFAVVATIPSWPGVAWPMIPFIYGYLAKKMNHHTHYAFVAQRG
jgi:hypothetical protein